MHEPLQILLTRPYEQSQLSAVLLRALGHEVHIHPLMQVAWLDGAVDALQTYAQKHSIAAWMVTSKHGLDVLSEAVMPEQRATARVYVPSSVSGDYARLLGWNNVREGQGDALSMVAQLRADLPDASCVEGHIVYVRGEDVRHDVCGLLADDGYRAHEITAYAAQSVLEFSPEMTALWRDDVLHVVMLYSPRSALLLEDGLRAAGLLAHAARVHVVALSTAVAHTLDRECWAGIHAAPSPTQDAMLVTLKALYSEI